MNRSLHTKLVLIMLLLILSLVAVTCVFLVKGVQDFFLDQFYEEMQSAFSMPEFVDDLREAVAGEEPVARVEEILGAYVGTLGIDNATRYYYILDGGTGDVLAGSDGQTVRSLEMTPNILTALTGEEGYAGDTSASYMDVAIPLENADGGLIIYIRDNKQTVEALNMELVLIIMEALIIGLVISVLLGLLLSKTMVTPIQSLTRAAEKVAAGDFSEKIVVHSRDEIGTLTRTFNNMASQLETTLDEVEGERDKLSTVFLHMTDGVAAFARDGSIMHYNPAAERMLGKSLSGNARYDEIFGDLAPMDQVLKMRAPDFVSAEETVGRRDLEISLAPFRGDGAQGGVLAVLHDVTEQKRTQELHREFVANVSHELRTPITSIRGCAETLTETEGLPEELRQHFLRVILNESDRMTKIVQDLLTLSRLDAESGKLELEWFSIRQSLQDVFDAMTLPGEKQGLELHLDLDPSLPAQMCGDRARIEQVILNILSNAVKYTPAGGTVQVTGARVGDQVRIQVQDTGIGIPQEDLPRLFERFYRVDKARSRELGGTGLGLAIANEIVQQHGGSISIESQVGQGTTCTVLLPLEGPSHG